MLIAGGASQLYLLQSDSLLHTTNICHFKCNYEYHQVVTHDAIMHAWVYTSVYTHAVADRVDVRLSGMLTWLRCFFLLGFLAGPSDSCQLWIAKEAG